MLGYCYLCKINQRTNYIGYFCNECKKIQDLIHIYESRVYEVLDSVLVRNKKQQSYKISKELKKEIEQKKYNLKSIVE